MWYTYSQMSLLLVIYLEGFVNLVQGVPLKIEPTEFRKRLYLKTLNAFFLYETEQVKKIITKGSYFLLESQFLFDKDKSTNYSTC